MDSPYLFILCKLKTKKAQAIFYVFSCFSFKKQTNRICNWKTKVDNMCIKCCNWERKCQLVSMFPTPLHYSSLFFRHKSNPSINNLYLKFKYLFVFKIINNRKASQSFILISGISSTISSLIVDSIP